MINTGVWLKTVYRFIKEKQNSNSVKHCMLWRAGMRVCLYGEVLGITGDYPEEVTAGVET